MKTILVVDDTAMLREPIAATLRLKGYQTLMATNGQEALQIARAQQPDLILLDVAMPVMDGLTCLRALRSDSAVSQIPVIMLTAMSEREVIVQAGQMGVAGFLLKTGFSTAELITRVRSLIGEPGAAAVQGTGALETTPERTGTSAPASADAPAVAAPAPPTAPADQLTKSMVLQRLTQEIELRSIKPVLEYVIALTRSHTSTLEEVAAAIRQDPALALRVLRVANSSLYYRGRGVKNLLEATQMIGLTAVRNTVIAILAIDHFEQATESRLIPQRFWEHSLAAGVLAEVIGAATFNPKTDQLFLAGLLHDVGRMVLSTIYPKEYAAVIARAEEQDLDLEVVERETFELSHTEATRHLLGRWDLPPSIVEAASLHELPIEKLRKVKQDTQSILAVALANRMAHALIAGNSGNARLLPYQEFASELGLDNTAIDRIATAALKKTTDMEMFYAAQSTQHFRGPLAVELAKKASIPPRIVVLGPDVPIDPISFYFKQLGWLVSELPTAAVILARSRIDFTRYLPALNKLDSAGPGPVPVIIISTSGAISVPAEWSYGRQTESLSLPCGYSRLVDAVIRCSRAMVPVAVPAVDRSA